MEEVTVKMMKGAPGMELVPISDTRLSSLGQIQIMKRNITAQGALPWAAVAVAVLPTFLLVNAYFPNQSAVLVCSCDDVAPRGCAAMSAVHFESYPPARE